LAHVPPQTTIAAGWHISATAKKELDYWAD
jgi:hypothetical protein